MKQRRIYTLLTIAALALTLLLILTAPPLASTAAPHLERQPLESLTALNSTEATERGAPLSAFSVPSVASVVQSPGTTTRISAALRSSPVMFIENVGQFDERARFQVRGGIGTMWLVEDAIWVTVLEEPSSPQPPSPNLGEGGAFLPSPKFGRGAGGEGQPRKGVNLRLTFPGANPHPRIEPFDRLDTVVSYFIGNDPEQWQPDVPVWGGVRYVDLYPGVDLEMTGASSNWTWRLVFRNPQSEIHIPEVPLRVEGTDSLALDDAGYLRLTTAVGDFTLPLLKAVTIGDTPLDLAAAQPTLTGDEIRAPFAAPTSNPQPLNLQSPTPQSTTQDNPDDLLYSTFLGGSLRDSREFISIAVDGAGSAYVTGYTDSADFPTTPGAFDTSLDGLSDAFVVKINTGGTGLVYATFLGGSDFDWGHAIAVDEAGSAYVTGGADSADFPTTAGAFDTSHNGDFDAFVAKVNAGGTGLLYATFLGGSSAEEGTGIAMDATGSAYVTGWTDSSDFPTTAGAFDTTSDGRDAFVVKVNAAGTGLVYATFLGGSDSEGWGSAIAVNGAGSAYVAGTTWSSDFPTTPGAFDASYNGGLGDAFVVKVNAAGTELVYATFLGGSSGDYGRAIAVDEVDSAYIVGSAGSSDFPTTSGAFDTTHSDGSDAFVVKVNAGGTGLNYATFVGENTCGFRPGCAIAVDGAGNAYIAGVTRSSDFPTTPGAFDTTHNGYYDAFVAKVNASGTGLAYATFLGGSADDGYGFPGCAIAVDGAGNAYIAGGTRSSDFPTTAGAFDTSYNGDDDGFVAKLAVGGGPGPTPTPIPQDPLTLSASSTYATNEHVTARTRVYNSSSTSKTFNVTVSLLKNGATVDSLPPQTSTVAGYGTSPPLTFDFGTRAAGSYQIKAELWEGSTLIAVRERDITVLASDDQARALRWADLLKRSADREFQEGADLVADTDVDALKRMGEELLGKAFSLLIGWIGDLGRAAGLLNTGVDSAAATVSAKLTELKRAWSMSVVKGLRVAVMEEINTYLAPQRQQVASKHQEMYGFVQGHAFTWPNRLERTLASYDDAIRSRVESEEISAVLQPPRFIGKSTLTGYRASYDFYDLYGKIFSAIALAAAVGVILISVFVSGGLSLTAIVPALATLRHNAALIALGVTGLLGLIAIGMDTSFEHTVAPAITAQHAQSQDSFRAALESASGAAFSDFTTNVPRIEGRRVSLATQLRNADGEEARPLVETYIYSPDGRVVEILSAQPDLSPGQQTVLQGDVTLPPGPYRAVSAVHTREHIGLSTQAAIFQVPGPQVQLALSLTDPQLILGEALNATVFITNTDPISGTGELAVMAVSSDEENFQTWTVNLDPGASERLDYSFVPQAEGAYRLDASVSDGYELLARQSAAYVVGAGTSLALNYSVQALYDPGLDVTLPVTVTNAGTIPTSTTFSLVTLDRLNDLTQVHSQIDALTVGAGADVSLDATALPSAQPGLYTSRLLLDGALHASLDFAVAAEDTLFADIYPDAVFHNVSDSITLTVGIMDSAYNHTDATIDVTLWQPDGVTETVTMSSIAMGQYEGSVTAPITGTYIATVKISKPNCRAIGSSTYFVAGQRSSLWPTLEGGPILGQTAPLTVTVRNEVGLAIEDATLALSGTVESLVGNTNAAGLAVLWSTATVTDSYQLTVDKTGFAQTVTEVLVQVITDTVPPWLYLDAPGVTNQTPLTVTGGAEAKTAVTVNDQPVAVDTQGIFTATVALSEGDNLITAVATDLANNSTTVTRTVNLDTIPPALAVTAPREGLFTNSDVVTVTGSAEVTASLSVSGTLSTVQPDGSFTAWTLLKRGRSAIPVVSTDAASNSTTITRTVGYSPLFGDFDCDCEITVLDIMQVASRWEAQPGDPNYDPAYDLDNDGRITIADIMHVAAHWGETCG